MRCKVCQGEYFDVYKRAMNVGVEEFVEGLSSLEEVPVTISYIQCSQCWSTVWGIAVGWYPYLTADRERWVKQNVNPEKNELDMLVMEEVISTMSTEEKVELLKLIKGGEK